MRDYLLVIGLMTGNSLDGVDAVLTRFDRSGSFEDLAFATLKSPAELTYYLRELRSAVKDAGGDAAQAEQIFNRSQLEQPAKHAAAVLGDRPAPVTVEALHQFYTDFLAQGVTELLARAREDKTVAAKYDLSATDLVGSHGQTLGHCPPSVGGSSTAAWTAQFGSGQLLADKLGTAVVSDFRSDDLFAGGEGAPMAPQHHQHLALVLESRGQFPITFCNAGNTGNITVVSRRTTDRELVVRAWDCGPFNHYPDRLMQLERGTLCDRDGADGSKGKISAELLQLLFDAVARTESGENFFELAPPKSADPQWYLDVPELFGKQPVRRKKLAFEDRLRTAEYFSAYVMAYSLRWVPADVELPRRFALSGGGWSNPLCLGDLTAILSGADKLAPILESHRSIFSAIRRRFGGVVETKLADEFGISAAAMEARTFADAAVQRVLSEPFTRPEITGVREPTVCGVLSFPKGQRGTAALEGWLGGRAGAIGHESMWSRAALKARSTS